jgi:hypothetical protein
VFVEYVANSVCASLELMLKGARGEPIDESKVLDYKAKMLERMLDEKLGRFASVMSTDAIDSIERTIVLPALQRYLDSANRFASFYKALHITLTAILADPQATIVPRPQRLSVSANLERVMAGVRLRELGQLELKIQFSGFQFNVGADIGYTTTALVSIGEQACKIELTSSKRIASIALRYDSSGLDIHLDVLASAHTADHLAFLQTTTGIALPD